MIDQEDGVGDSIEMRWAGCLGHKKFEKPCFNTYIYKKLFSLHITTAHVHSPFQEVCFICVEVVERRNIII